MVNESVAKSPVFITPPSTVATYQSNSANLSWKFFDNYIEYPDDQQKDETEDIDQQQNYYAGDLSSTEGLLMISNPTLYQNSNNHYQPAPPTTMNTSSTSDVGQNHNHHQQQQQQQIHHHPSSNSNNTGSNTGLLRSEIGDGMGTSHHHHPRPGIIAHSTGPGSGGGGGCDDDGNTGFHLGLHGWRKKCLYVLILGLMVLIIVNLILTLWILKVMEFSSEGMGQLKIVAGGIQLSGQALVLDLLRASAIRSRHGQPISIESSRNFSINTRDPDGQIENHLFLGHDRLECLATEFRINDTHGGNLFSVNRNEVTIGAHTLRIDGEGGAVFQDSIQTSHIRAEAGRELKLESPTRQVEIMATNDIILQSKAGNLELTAQKDIKLNSVAGSILLGSPQILLPNLKTAQSPQSGSSSSMNGKSPNNHDHHANKVYQLCACYNGKLFLASARSICAGDDVSICR